MLQLFGSKQLHLYKKRLPKTAWCAFAEYHCRNFTLHLLGHPTEQCLKLEAKNYLRYVSLLRMCQLLAVLTVIIFEESEKAVPNLIPVANWQLLIKVLTHVIGLSYLLTKNARTSKSPQSLKATVWGQGRLSMVSSAAKFY